MRKLDNSDSGKQFFEDGKRILSGRVGADDERRAVQSFRLAAKLGHAEAAYMVGAAYDEGVGVRRDFRRAYSWYQKAAALGSGSAALNAGILVRDGVVRESDWQARAFDWFSQAASAGEPAGWRELGRCYFLGVGAKEDTGQAVKCYRRSAIAGDAVAQSNLGACYLFGEGVARSWPNARKWLKRSAAQGHPTASYFLGFAYEQGEGPIRDAKRALEYYLSPAETGNSDAIEGVGRLVNTRQLSGSSQERAQVIRALCRGSESGAYVARRVLGDYLQSIVGGNRNLIRAANEYHEAAHRGDAVAQYRLGDCYLRGIGRSRNVRWAKYWLTKAEAAKCPSATKLLREIEASP